MPKNQTHMILSTIWPGTMLCFHCGGREKIAMPIPLDEMGKSLRAFTAKHRRCKLSDAGAELRAIHQKAFRRYVARREAGRMPA